jgi:heme/copper-type cytochrome/quinol oxidase subunit 2
MIVFAMGMLLAAGFSFRAVASGVHGLPPRDRNRAQRITLLAPVVLILVCIAIFPWSAIL